MKTNLQKWGNSLGIRIPSTLAKKLSLHAGIILEIKIENGLIVLYPKKYSLEQMLSQITDENRHTVVWDEDETRGNEEW